jgi:AcrR family transcriptional regulator
VGSQERRRYESPRRREQAAATRLAILEAAERLFAERGYVSTSVGAIAEEASVALKTVYAVFGTKAELLRALWNLRMRGDEDSTPMAERSWFREIIAEPDPQRRLALVARTSRLVKERTAAAELPAATDILWALVGIESVARRRPRAATRRSLVSRTRTKPVLTARTYY